MFDFVIYCLRRRCISDDNATYFSGFFTSRLSRTILQSLTGTPSVILTTKPSYAPFFNSKQQHVRPRTATSKNPKTIGPSIVFQLQNVFNIFFFFKNHTCLMVHHSTVRVSTLSIVENGNQGDGCTITTKMFLRSALRSGDDDSNRKSGQPTSTNAGNELAAQQKNRRGGATGLLPLFYGMHFVARYGTPCCEWVSEVAGASGWTRYLPPIFGLHMWCIGEDVWRREPMPRFRFGADI